jgi:hypothetical protein
MGLRLPPGYYVEHDPDLLVLRRADGASVAAFSARGAIGETVEEVAWEDHRRRSTQKLAGPRGEGRDRRR